MERDPLLSVRQAVASQLQAVRVPKGAVLLVAVSGGQDSLCLLDSLANLRSSFEIRLVATHVDHQIRPDDAAAEEAVVREVASGLGVEVKVVRGDVPRYARRWRMGIEEAARLLRYQGLSAMAAREGAWGAATGHTADDLAESLLINILRGTGPTGLRSITPYSKLEAASLREPYPELVDWFDASLPELRVVRPLLEIRRLTTEAYCRSANLPFRLDPTNQDPSILRNRVRHHLLPLLQTYNPSIVESLGRLSRLAADDEAELQSAVEAVWQSDVKREPEGIFISWRAWGRVSPALQRRLLRRAWQALGGYSALSYQALEDGRLLLEGRPVGRQLDLGSGAWLRTSRQGVLIGRGPVLEPGVRKE